MIQHLDTQVLIWFFRRRASKISRRALTALEAGRNVISPAVLLEVEVLFELGRCSSPADEVLAAVGPLLGLEVSNRPFRDIIEAGRSFAWTRDPFDRLIVANAMADGAKLVTADTVILEHFKDAVW